MEGMQNLLQQAQMLQKKMMEMQEELKKKVVEASAGGGMVKVKATGGQEIVAIEIDPNVVDPKDVQMLQDLILAATNEALKKAKDMVQEEMSKLTGGLNLPGLF